MEVDIHMRNTNSGEIVKNIIGEVQYKRLSDQIIKNISKKIKQDISLKDKLFVLDIFCFVLLRITNTESVNLDGKYKININEESVEITREDVEKDYVEYIKLIKGDI